GTDVRKGTFVHRLAAAAPRCVIAIGIQDERCYFSGQSMMRCLYASARRCLRVNASKRMTASVLASALPQCELPVEEPLSAGGPPASAGAIPSVLCNAAQ